MVCGESFVESILLHDHKTHTICVRLPGACSAAMCERYGNSARHRSGDECSAALLQQGDGALHRRAQGVQLGCLRGDVGDDGTLLVEWWQRDEQCLDLLDVDPEKSRAN